MSFKKKIRNYHFEIYHFIILLIIVIIAQLTLSYVNVKSAESLVNRSMEMYRWDTAERFADFTTSSLELLIQQSLNSPPLSQKSRSSAIEALDFILNQQRLQRNVEDICLFFNINGKILDIDDGKELYQFIIEGKPPQNRTDAKREYAKSTFLKDAGNLFQKELIHNYKEGTHIFHVLVPFSIRGEVVGAVYMKIVPDFSNIIKTVASSFDQSGLLFSAVILLSLLAMFLITTYLVRERDQAHLLLFNQKEKQLKQKIENEKEATFARRIYHAHHKAEKVVGFIKEDLRNLSYDNLEKIRTKVSKYANFIGRVIYDMKTYNPPNSVIRNPNFKTNLNDVIKFIVNNIFKRVYREGDQFKIILNLDQNLPIVRINEYVIWQIIEPLIQNSIDHNKRNKVTITVKTSFDANENKTYVEIMDDGVGIEPDLLNKNKNGIKKIFLDNLTTKDQPNNSGYGCYLAYESCRLCGWQIDAANLEHGAKMLIIVSH